ncbi:MAG: HAD family hydrolase [Alphaproteobacteria bacterium]
MSEIKIAMWSGPRNLSTAMMRSFENRPDCRVWDEPYYAAYLAASGIVHPMNDEILAAHENDPLKVAATCLEDVRAETQTYFYQKHMPHHMLDSFDISWISKVRNAFLVRAPERVLASYAAKREEVTLEDLGYKQQHQIFQQLCDKLGKAPPVVEAEDVRGAPKRTISALCAALDMPFHASMLNWPAGKRDSDGVWAAHWYKNVEQSTGFAPLPEDDALPNLPDHLRVIAEQARPLFEELQQFKV